MRRIVASYPRLKRITGDFWALTKGDRGTEKIHMLPASGKEISSGMQCMLLCLIGYLPSFFFHWNAHLLHSYVKPIPPFTATELLVGLAAHISSAHSARSALKMTEDDKNSYYDNTYLWMRQYCALQEEGKLHVRC